MPLESRSVEPHADQASAARRDRIEVVSVANVDCVGRGLTCPFARVREDFGPGLREPALFRHDDDLECFEQAGSAELAPLLGRLTIRDHSESVADERVEACPHVVERNARRFVILEESLKNVIGLGIRETSVEDVANTSPPLFGHRDLTLDKPAEVALGSGPPDTSKLFQAAPGLETTVKRLNGRALSTSVVEQRVVDVEQEQHGTSRRESYTS